MFTLENDILNILTFLAFVTNLMVGDSAWPSSDNLSCSSLIRTATMIPFLPQETKPSAMSSSYAERTHTGQLHNLPREGFNPTTKEGAPKYSYDYHQKTQNDQHSQQQHYYDYHQNHLQQYYYDHRQNHPQQHYLQGHLHYHHPQNNHHHHLQYQQQWHPHHRRGCFNSSSSEANVKLPTQSTENSHPTAPNKNDSFDKDILKNTWNDRGKDSNLPTTPPVRYSNSNECIGIVGKAKSRSSLKIGCLQGTVNIVMNSNSKCPVYACCQAEQGQGEWDDVAMANNRTMTSGGSCANMASNCSVTAASPKSTNTTTTTYSSSVNRVRLTGANSSSPNLLPCGQYRQKIMQSYTGNQDVSHTYPQHQNQPRNYNNDNSYLQMNGKVSSSTCRQLPLTSGVSISHTQQKKRRGRPPSKVNHKDVKTSPCKPRIPEDTLLSQSTPICPYSYPMKMATPLCYDTPPTLNQINSVKPLSYYDKPYSYSPYVKKESSSVPYTTTPSISSYPMETSMPFSYATRSIPYPIGIITPPTKCTTPLSSSEVKVTTNGRPCCPKQMRLATPMSMATPFSSASPINGPSHRPQVTPLTKTTPWTYHPENTVTNVCQSSNIQSSIASSTYNNSCSPTYETDKNNMWSAPSHKFTRSSNNDDFNINISSSEASGYSSNATDTKPNDNLFFHNIASDTTGPRTVTEKSPQNGCTPNVADSKAGVITDKSKDISLSVNPVHTNAVHATTNVLYKPNVCPNDTKYGMNSWNFRNKISDNHEGNLSVPTEDCGHVTSTNLQVQGYKYWHSVGSNGRTHPNIDNE